MKEVPQATKDKWSQNMKDKYNHRYVKGDVVEVREDGYWTKDHGYNKTAFAVVIVLGISKKDYIHYQEALTKGIDEDEELIKRRKYRLKIEDFDTGKKDDIATGKYVSFSAVVDIPIEIKGVT